MLGDLIAQLDRPEVVEAVLQTVTPQQRSRLEAKATQHAMTIEDFAAGAVREFVELAFGQIGRSIVWKGSGVEEKGYCSRTGRILVAIDPAYYRPTEVDLLLGDPQKARTKLGWTHKTAFGELVREMVHADCAALRGGHADELAELAPEAAD